MSRHKPVFTNYINKKLGLDTFDTWDEDKMGGDELRSMLKHAMKIIKDEINSDDPDRRLKAAIAVMELNAKHFDI